MTDAEKLALLKRYIEEPGLSSDKSLRFQIAHIMGWRVERRFYDQLALANGRAENERSLVADLHFKLRAAEARIRELGSKGAA